MTIRRQEKNLALTDQVELAAQDWSTADEFLENAKLSFDTEIGFHFIVREKGHVYTFDDRRQELYCKTLAATGQPVKAREAASVNPFEVYAWKKSDRVFSHAVEVAKAIALDDLVSEARRRAVDGVEVPQYHMGELIGYVRKYSDTLLKTLLGGLDPRFRTKPADTNITVNVDVPQQGGVVAALRSRITESAN